MITKAGAGDCIHWLVDGVSILWLACGWNG
jgi:hypothetical protein